MDNQKEAQNEYIMHLTSLQTEAYIILKMKLREVTKILWLHRQ